MPYRIVYITVVVVMILGAFSCKSDYEVGPVVISPPTDSDFYVRGTNYFNEVDAFDFEYLGGEFIYEGSTVSYGSASSTGHENGNKYIASTVSINASTFRGRTFNEGDGTGGPINLVGGLGVYIKLTTDQPASQADIKFTKEELEELLQVGQAYEFGTAPGQIEIGMVHRPLPPEYEDTVSWGWWGILGTSDLEEPSGSFTIVDIDTYEDPTSQNNDIYAKGFKVKVNFDVRLRNHLWIHTDIILEDVEGVFFFEYE